MADNTTLNTMTGGDAVRDKDRAGVKTQIVGLDINPSGSEVLGTGDAANGLDVDVTRPPGDPSVSTNLTGLNIAATLAIQGAGTVMFSFAAGLVGTVTFEGLADNGIWSQLQSSKVGGGGNTAITLNVTNPTTTSIYLCNVAGYQQVRARCSAYTSGSAVAYVRYSAIPQSSMALINNSTDGVFAGNNFVNSAMAVMGYVYNGTGWDMARGDVTNGAWVNVKTGAVGSSTATGASTPANAFFAGMIGGTSTLAGLSSVVNSGATGASRATVLGTGQYVDNGTTMDVAKSATAAKNTTGVGLPGVGALGFDGTNYQALKTDSSGNLEVGMVGSTGAVTPLSSVVNSGATGAARSTVLGTASYVDNGTTMDATKSIVNATNSTGTGIVAAGILAQLDDTSPTAITENQFGNLRMTADRALLVSLKPDTNSQATVSRIKSAASTNGTNIKASAGMLVGYDLSNQAAYDVYLKFYAKATAPTVGTDTPAFTIKIPAGGGRNVEWSTGVPIGTGISYAITKLVADSDTTAVVAEDLHGFIITR